MGFLCGLFKLVAQWWIFMHLAAKKAAKKLYEQIK
jgi:hypothetical protein